MTRGRTTNRQGARWTLYGLPGGYTTAAPAGVPLIGWQDRHAVPLLTFRGGPGVSADRYDHGIAARLNYARGWALYAYTLGG